MFIYDYEQIKLQIYTIGLKIIQISLSKKLLLMKMKQNN